jgi:hypothetical protein
MKNILMKLKRLFCLCAVSGISKLRRYLTGGMIGMCFQYVYKRMLCFFGIHDWKYFSNGSDNGKFCKRCKKYRLDNIDQTQINELR